MAKATQPVSPAFEQETETTTDEFFNLGPGLLLYRCQASSLENHRLNVMPGDLLVVDTRVTEREQLATEDAVVVELYDKEHERVQVSVLRQFIKPNLLMTNCKGANSIINLDDDSRPFDHIVKGKIIRVAKGA